MNLEAMLETEVIGGRAGHPHFIATVFCNREARKAGLLWHPLLVGGGAVEPRNRNVIEPEIDT
jgi:hypothetical protein